MERLFDPDRLACDKCEKLHQGWGRKPKCKECLPELMEENKQAVMVYSVCRDQVITSFSGVVALDIKSIEIAMKRCGISSDRVFFQVLALGRHFINRQQKRSK